MRAIDQRENTRAWAVVDSTTDTSVCRSSSRIFSNSPVTTVSSPSRVWTNQLSEISSAPVTPAFLFFDRATSKISARTSSRRSRGTVL